MATPPIGRLFPVGGPVPPELVIGRTGEIEEIVRRLQEGISTLLQGERRIGKTTVCNAACDQIEGGVLRLEVPERRGGNSADLLQLIIDACAIASATGVAKKVLRTLRPTLEKVLKDEGIPLDLSELGAEPNLLPVRRVLSLPVDVANTLGAPIVFFLDELQRTVDYSDGEVLVRDLVDVYSGHRTVTVLVDGSDQRAFEMLYRDVQLDKLCDRLSLSETIPAAVWREALPARFEMADLVLTEEALALIVDFGAERPFPTMLAALHTALSARRLRDGAPVGEFEATMGIDEAKRQLDFGGGGV